jgi:nucleoside phosphorylase
MEGTESVQPHLQALQAVPDSSQGLQASTQTSPYVPYDGSPRNKKQGTKTFDVGVIIALDEEFRHFLKFLKESTLWDVPINPLQFWEGDLSFHSFELKKGSRTVQVVACMVGEMGTEHTGIRTTMLVDKWHVPFIVNIGLTGSLNDELKVGSILVPTQITHYTANWKAEDQLSSIQQPIGGTAFAIGTRAFASNNLVVNQLTNFLVSNEYAEWQALCARDIRSASLPQPEDGFPKDYSVPPEVRTGHLASGNIVVDSKDFKNRLKSTDRKLMGCEMEAAGFAIAERYLQSSLRFICQFVALRCISDMATDKASAEHMSGGCVYINGHKMQNREYAMRNATILFLYLILKRVLNADVNTQMAQLESIKIDIRTTNNETAKRGRSSPHMSAEDLIRTIKKRGDVTSLTEDNMKLICHHYGASEFESSKGGLGKQVTDYLEQDGKIARKRKRVTASGVDEENSDYDDNADAIGDTASRTGSVDKKRSVRISPRNCTPNSSELGTPISSFSVNTTEGFKTPSGEETGDTQPIFEECVLIANLADLAKNLSDKICSSGKSIPEGQYNTIRSKLEDIIRAIDG